MNVHRYPSHSPRRRGVTIIEVLVVVGAITVLLSLVLPMVYGIRASARRTQCAANMRGIHQAMMMYSIDNARVGEVYPGYITNLYGSGGDGGGYVSDPRMFVCPMDDTNATKNRYGNTALKPIYSLSPAIPKDDKSDWAERIDSSKNTWNCSYLYEFSTRICQTYTVDLANIDFGGSWNDYSPSSFGNTYLVFYDSDAEAYWGADGYDPDPLYLDRTRNFSDVDGWTTGYVTWQDAKFWQLAYGDIYCTGYEDWTNGGYPAPPGEFKDPIDWYIDHDIWEDKYKMGGYSRTWMPMIRCFWHQTPQKIDNEDVELVQNVALDGNIFNSAPFWERTAFKYGFSVSGENETPVEP